MTIQINYVNTTAFAASGGGSHFTPLSAVASSPDGVFASATGVAGFSDSLLCTNFGFSFPANAIINSITPVVTAKYTKDTAGSSTADIHATIQLQHSGGNLTSSTSFVDIIDNAATGVVGNFSGTVISGTAITITGVALSDLLNSPDFGLNIGFAKGIADGASTYSFFFDTVGLVVDYTQGYPFYKTSTVARMGNGGTYKK